MFLSCACRPAVVHFRQEVVPPYPPSDTSAVRFHFLKVDHWTRAGVRKVDLTRGAGGSASHNHVIDDMMMSRWIGCPTMDRAALDDFFARADDVLTDWDESQSYDAACSTDDDLGPANLILPDHINCRCGVLPVGWTLDNAHLDVPPADNQLDRLEEARLLAVMQALMPRPTNYLYTA